MRRFTFIIFCLSIYSMAQAQYYSEDFSSGLNGWTTRTTDCGMLPGEMTGTWSLIEGTYSGIEIPNLNARFIVTNGLEYVATVSTPLGDGYLQGQYQMMSDTFSSNLNGEVLPIGETAFGVDAGVGLYTTWFSNLNVPQNVLDQGGNTAFGIGDPSLTVSNDTMTITSQDSLTALTYLRINDCGQLWMWNHNGNVGKGALAGDGTQITSPTGDNGCMSMNTDFMTTLGNSDNIPAGGPPYPQYVAELISPVIDLSGVEAAVSLRFSQLLRFLNPATSAPGSLRTSYSVSTDGGVTWGDPIELNENLAVNAAPYNTTEEVALVGIQGEANARIKFTFGVDFYYWVIDDVQIVDRISYDMQVNENFFGIYPNAVTPISQVEPVGFLADIQNNGGFNATNTTLNLTIVNDTTGAVIYNQDKLYGTIPPDSLAENDFFAESLDPSLLEVGSFTGTYSISQDSTDLLPENDTIRWQMFVTDTIFAKETGRTRAVAPAADDSYYYGNCFYLPNGDGWFARYITFACSNPDEVADRTITIFLYRWEGDTNNDGQGNPDEYGNAPIAFNSYTFTGMEGDGELITLPFDLDGNSVPLEDDVFYVAMIQYTTDDDQAFFLEASTAYDYGAMHFLTDSLGVERQAAMLAVGGDANPAFSLIGFGRDIVPLVRMSIGTNPDLNGPAIVGTRDVLSDANQFKVYPNPTNNEINLEVALEALSKKVEIRVFDVSGKMLHRQQYSNMQSGKFTYDVSTLASGTYFVHIVTDQGIKTQKVIVKH